MVHLPYSSVKDIGQGASVKEAGGSTLTMYRHFISLFRARGPQVVAAVSLANICFEHTRALADGTNAAPHSFPKLARPLRQTRPKIWKCILRPSEF
jgi:hypothetical protein